MNGGSGGQSGMEGAMGAGDDIAATIGLFWTNDDGFDDDMDVAMSGLDFQATMGQFSLAGELASMDDDIEDATGIDSPWSLTASMMFGDDEFEAALRLQDLDDTADTTVTAVGVNWYQTGRNAYWSLNYTDYDNDAGDGSVIGVGLSVGASR